MDLIEVCELGACEEVILSPGPSVSRSRCQHVPETDTLIPQTPSCSCQRDVEPALPRRRASTPPARHCLPHHSPVSGVGPAASVTVGRDFPASTPPARQCLPHHSPVSGVGPAASVTVGRDFPRLRINGVVLQSQSRGDLNASTAAAAAGHTQNVGGTRARSQEQPCIYLNVPCATRVSVSLSSRPQRSQVPSASAQPTKLSLPPAHHVNHAPVSSVSLDPARPSTSRSFSLELFSDENEDEQLTLGSLSSQQESDERCSKESEAGSGDPHREEESSSEDKGISREISGWEAKTSTDTEESSSDAKTIGTEESRSEDTSFGTEDFITNGCLPLEE